MAPRPHLASLRRRLRGAVGNREVQDDDRQDVDVPPRVRQAFDQVLECTSSAVTDAQLADALAIFPVTHETSPDDDQAWRRFVNLVHPDYYWAQALPSERPQLDPRPRVAVCETVVHWLTQGARRGLRPSIFFLEDWYRTQLSKSNIPDIEPGTDAFADFVLRGWDLGVSPTPLFDADFYSSAYPDVPASDRAEAWRHFAMDGCRDSRKRPGPITLSRRVPAAPARRPIGRPVLLPAFVQNGALVTPSPDESVREALSRTALLHEPDFQDLIARVAEVEPMVRLTPGSPTYTLPPRHHAYTELVARAERVRTDLPRPHADVVVLAEGTEGGLARDMVNELLTGLPPELTALVVTTGRHGDARLPRDIVHVDLQARTGDLPALQQELLLLDVLRGTSPSSVVNVGSTLGWHVFRTYGRQLSSETRLAAIIDDDGYDEHGRETGAHIEWLEICFEHLQAVALRDDTLRTRLVARYALNERLAARLVTWGTAEAAAAVVTGSVETEGS